MKNILLILNGTLTPPHVIDSAINIASSTSSLLHTIFINYESDLAEYNYLFPNDLSLTRNRLTGKTIAEENAELAVSQVRLFADECKSANVDFFIEPKTDISLGDIISLSAFADFIVADAHENFKEHHIADLLRSVHCPMYLVSKESAATRHVVLAYDGSPSSIYAIKIYSYLFTEFRDLPTHLVYVNEGKETGLPDEEKLKMWLPGHYRDLEIVVLHGDADEVLADFTASLPNSLVVMGSYGRKNVSRFFHKSTANKIIDEGLSSVFMAHQ
jgi:nucleotide-binding universal stress UspA family protein